MPDSPEVQAPAAGKQSMRRKLKNIGREESKIPSKNNMPTSNLNKMVSESEVLD